MKCDSPGKSESVSAALGYNAPQNNSPLPIGLGEGPGVRGVAIRSPATRMKSKNRILLSILFSLSSISLSHRWRDGIEDFFRRDPQSATVLRGAAHQRRDSGVNINSFQLHEPEAVCDFSPIFYFRVFKRQGQSWHRFFTNCHQRVIAKLNVRPRRQQFNQLGNSRLCNGPKNLETYQSIGRSPWDGDAAQSAGHTCPFRKSLGHEGQIEPPPRHRPVDSLNQQRQPICSNPTYRIGGYLVFLRSSRCPFQDQPLTQLLPLILRLPLPWPHHRGQHEHNHAHRRNHDHPSPFHARILSQILPFFCHQIFLSNSVPVVPSIQSSMFDSSTVRRFSFSLLPLSTLNF